MNVRILTMHVNVIMGCQLDEHLLFWQPDISIILYFALHIVMLFEMQIEYDDMITIIIIHSVTLYRCSKPSVEMLLNMYFN